MIVYDARQHRIWLRDQTDWSSTDPALRGVPNAASTSANWNSSQHTPSRDAGDVLRDINTWFRTFEVRPGDGDDTDPEWSEPSIDLPALYKKNGWPDNFDGEAFDADFARAKCLWQVKYIAEEPVRTVQEKIESTRWRYAVRERLQERLAAATDQEEEWDTRYAIWGNSRGLARVSNDIEEATQKAALLCPGDMCWKSDDLPLWELGMLREEHARKASHFASSQKLTQEAEASGDQQAQLREKTRLRHAEKEATTYHGAYESSKTDAEKLYPGQTFDSATAIKFPAWESKVESDEVRVWERKIKDLQKSLAETEEWRDQLPETVTGVREKVEYDIQRQVEALYGAQRYKKNAEEWLAAHPVNSQALSN